MVTRLAERATGCSLRWTERSIKRQPDNEQLDLPDSTPVVIEVNASGGISEKKGAPYLDATVDLQLSGKDVELRYVFTCRFFFEADTEPPASEEAVDFMRQHGASYTLGFVNAALAHDTQLFGLKPMTLPVLAIEDISAADPVADQPEPED
ncbi:hypothetical protein [Nocardia sp. NPDC023988]|uniref:hypothetical protein n=1 Tax=unclassified Nocardia TaxID=2637762 RepID=UPI0033F73523